MSRLTEKQIQLLNLWQKIDLINPLELTSNSNKNENGYFLFEESTNLDFVKFDYHIYFGAIKQSNCYNKIYEVLKSENTEFETNKTFLMGKIVFTKNDISELNNRDITISHFPIVIKELINNKNFSEYDSYLTRVNNDLTYYITHTFFKEEHFTLDYKNIDRICQYINSQISPFTEHTNHLYFKKKKKTENNQEADDTLGLNFFAKDIEKIISKNDINTTLSNYLNASLNIVDKSKRIDVRTNVNYLKDHFKNKNNFIEGCFPAKHTASLMQQFAINTIKNDLSHSEGLFSVNGPPGTGKTTLLKDVIGSIIVEKAKILATYKDPSDAFNDEAKKVEFKNSKAYFNFYELDKQLSDFGIVVTSSNNSAVENISKELPKKNLDENNNNIFITLSYLNECNLNNESEWGLFTAVLGRSKNIKDFEEKIFHEDKSIPNFKDYLETAKCDWDEAKENFNDSLKAVKDEINKIDNYRLKIDECNQLRNDISKLNSTLNSLSNSKEKLKTEIDELNESFNYNDTQYRNQLNELIDLKKQKPSFWDSIFKSKNHTIFNNLYQNKLSKISNLEESKSSLLIRIEKLKKESQEIENTLKSSSKTFEVYTTRIIVLEKDIEQESKNFKSNLADDKFWLEVDKDSQIHSPWYTENLKKLNSKLFIDSIKVNEAFVIQLNHGKDKKISHSIRAFLSVLQNKNKNEINNEDLQNLWNIFFLVFPIISTSFASLQTMFKGLEKNSLPWLFIDEAGQALPYSAVGALYRSKRAVIVGDPFQIEPVCTLPNIFIDSLIKHYNLDQDTLNPKLPSLISVQVISDRQNKYGTNINGTWVGSPLRVHRRCMNPMFDIANKMAYEDLMIYATKEKKSSILFNSGFLDVKGNVKGKHFVENQAIKIVEIINSEILHNDGKLPDLYIISPFSEIVYQLGKFIEKELSFDQQLLKVWIKSNIGTVHTFQGKEADGVILCLGLDTSKKSAAIWASGKPNLLNVALTRAKHKFIAVGDADLWLKEDIFPELKWLELLNRNLTTTTV